MERRSEVLVFRIVRDRDPRDRSQQVFLQTHDWLPTFVRVPTVSALQPRALAEWLLLSCEVGSKSGQGIAVPRLKDFVETLQDFRAVDVVRVIRVLLAVSLRV